jgi:hypothetical protein
MKKTITSTAYSKHPPQKRFTALVFGLILVFGLFSAFLPKTASASNNYVDNVIFHTDSAGFNRLKFHVKTSWTNKIVDGGDTCYALSYNQVGGMGGAGCINSACYQEWGLNFKLPEFYVGNGTCYGDFTWTAGNTYDVYLSAPDGWSDTLTFAQITGYPLWRNTYTSADYWRFNLNGNANQVYIPPFNDNEPYYFAETPTLTISFPHDNDEIAGAFYIDGTYTTPLENFNFLYLNAQIVGYEPQFNLALLELTNATGAIHELVPAGFGLPANDYILRFMFSGTGGTYDVPLQIPIRILTDIPPSLPNGETTPTIPQYGGKTWDEYYPAHSVYATSTALANDLKDAVGGVIQNIGDNLAQFANKFNLTDAQTSGLNLANSILTMRAYVGGINSFFGTLPVAQFLILYLIAFLGVVLFRLIKGLINLIKL